MKILHLDYDDLNNPNAAGGQAYTTRELMGRLAKNNKITVVTGNYKGSKNLNVDGITYVRLGIGRLGFTVSVLSHWLLLPFYVLFNQKNYDVILECFSSPFTVSFVPLVAYKPLIALPAFFDSEILAQKYSLPLDIFKRLLIKKYSRFITMTDELKKRIKLVNPTATYTVIPGGVSANLLKCKVPAVGKYVLYIGRIDIFNKGLKLLLDAWQKFDTPLIIAGSGRLEDEREVVRLIDNLNLGNRVKFIGRVTGRNKTELLRHSIFVVQPSLFETFGYVALEALASGKLLVCFDIPGYKWIPNNYALKIKNINSQDLSLGIKHALGSPQLLHQARKTNREFARKFGWDLIASSYQKELSLIL